MVPIFMVVLTNSDMRSSLVPGVSHFAFLLPSVVCLPGVALSLQCLLSRTVQWAPSWTALSQSVVFCNKVSLAVYPFSRCPGPFSAHPDQMFVTQLSSFQRSGDVWVMLHHIRQCYLSDGPNGWWSFELLVK